MMEQVWNHCIYHCIFRMFDTDGESAIQELQELLTDANIDVAVRQGDIYAVMIEYYAANSNFKSAVAALQQMKNNLPKVSHIED